MARRFGILMIGLLLMITVIGCGQDSKRTNIDPDEITRISVTFDNAEGVPNMVIVDLEEKTRKTVIYGEEKVENEEAFEADETFPGFIKDTVLEHISTGEGAKDGEDDGDTMRVVWRIQVLVGEESFQMNGFEGFPGYWDELLAYMGIAK